MDINNNEILEDENTEKIDINNNDIKNNINRNNIIIKKMKNQSHSQLNELTDKALNDKEKKNESSGEDILKNKINNNYIQYPKSDKYNNILKNDNKNTNIKISSKTVLGNHSKLKNKILENNMKEKHKNIIIKNSNQNLNKNYSYNKYNYNNLNLKKTKPDSCTKSTIIGILISIIVLQIAAIPLIINFYDFSV